MINKRKGREKNNRINSILTAAEDMITRRGFSKLRISDLAKELELSRGIIYYYFKNEENLIVNIISDKMEILLIRLRRIPPQENGLAELQQILKTFHKFLKEHTNYLDFISYFTTHRHDNLENSSKYHNEYEDKRNKLFSLCLNAVEKGIKDGSIYPVARPYQIAYMLWAAVGSFWQHMMRDNVLQPVKGPHSKDVDKMINIYFDMIFRALRK